MRRPTAFVALLAVLPALALAQDVPPSSEPAEPAAAPAAPATAATAPAPPEVQAGQDRGAFVAGALVGLAVPLDGLSPMASGTLEVGYVLPVLDRSFAVLVDVAYTAPSASGTVSNDPRVDGGTWTWKLTQKELTVSPAVYYRFTRLGRLVPFAGIGPRVYFHQSIVEGTGGGEPILPTTEQSTRVGLLVPLGVAWKLGPGEALGQLLFEWGRLDHVATGISTSGGVNVQLGYRVLF